MRLYDRHEYLDMFELVSRSACPMPSVRIVCSKSTLTTPRSSPVTNRFSLTNFIVSIGALNFSLFSTSCTSAPPYLWR